MIIKALRKSCLLISKPYFSIPCLSFKRFSEVPLQIPQRIYERQDFLFEDYTHIQSSTIYANSEEQILEIFRKFGPKMPVEILGDLTETILASQIDLSQKFNQKCAPIIAAYILKMTRDHSLTYGRILRDFALMEINSSLIWDALLKVFVEQRMHRYVPVELLVDTAINFSLGEFAPRQFFQEALPVIYAHRYRITESQMSELLDALDRLKFDDFKEKLGHISHSPKETLGLQEH